jgi:hypothetical protein
VGTSQNDVPRRLFFGPFGQCARSATTTSQERSGILRRPIDGSERHGLGFRRSKHHGWATWFSSVARYTGERFLPPDGDLASDEQTVLLFNFNEPAGSKTLVDESAHGLTGSLGVGFEAATSPQLVSDSLAASQGDGR